MFPLVFCDNCGAANNPQERVCFHCRFPLVPTSPYNQGVTVLSSTGQLAPGSIISGRYHIVKLVGQGGMGAVYKAIDLQSSRSIALKEMSQNSLSSPEKVQEAAEAFKREARMLSGLDHPHLPHMYDYFTDGGRWYLVMDFIEGKTLKKSLESMSGKHLPVEEVVKIGITLCAVLNYLHTHQQPIIFRDLKSDNIMLTDSGHLYLIDFGIARHFTPGKDDTVALGSIGYAAPEQYGKQARTSPRSDIYALGATLHELLSGSDPGHTPFKFHPLQAPVPPDLATLVMKMVEYKEDDRPAATDDVQKALEEILKRLRGGPQPPQGTIICIYTDHTDEVNAVVWSPDSKRVASASNDPSVHIWEAGTGKCILKYPDHTSAVNALAWSLDGKYIASGSNDRTVQVWSVTSGKLLFTYTGHSHRVHSIAWSPDGRYIASGGDDNKVHVWDAATGQQKTVYHGHLDSVYALTWSPDGKRVASASDDETVQVWVRDTGKNLITYHSHSDAIRTVSWSPDGTRIASGSWDKTIQVWDAASAIPISTLSSHKRMVNAIAWSPNGKYLASGGKDKAVLIWDVVKKDVIFTFDKHPSSIIALSWSPDGNYIASAGDDGTIYVWQAQ